MEINLIVILKTFIIGVMVSRTFCKGMDDKGIGEFKRNKDSEGETQWIDRIAGC